MRWLESDAATRIDSASDTAVALGPIRAHLRIDDGEDSDYLLDLIRAAESHVEELTGRPLQRQTWREAFAGFPAGHAGFRLSRRPLASVASVAYYGTDDTEREVAPAVYQVDDFAGVIVRRRGKAWPTADMRRSSAVVVEYIAGYETPPGDLVHAVRLLVAHMYEHREPEITGHMISRFGFALDALTLPYRVSWF